MTDTMRRHAVVLALAFSLAPLNAQQPLNPPLKNWAAPLYWAPTPAEAEQRRIEQRIVQGGASPLAQAASIFTAPGPMTFIAMTPCRVMDTRAGQGFTGAFGPPSLPAFGTARQVPMPSSSTCTIPSNAGAYSLNITAVSPGVLSFLSVWPAGQPYPNVSTLNDSSPSGGAVANAAIVPAGTLGAIQMVAGNVTDVIIDINGYYAAPTDTVGNTGIGTGTLAGNTTGYDNTAVGNNALEDNTGGAYNAASGVYALQNNTTGDANTASGYSALLANTTGDFNTASGASALALNTTGNNNTATGTGALQLNTTGNNNTASGYWALFSNTIGANNTALGYQALYSNSTGQANTAVGYQALQNNTSAGGGNTAVGGQALQNNTGYGNIAIGSAAGYFNTSGSDNIYVGSSGSSGDNGAIRIGNLGIASSFFVQGVYGFSAIGGVPVYVNGNGQLGTMNSSRRFKEQITDMGDSSSKLLQLRPVNFFYKPEYDDGSHLLQYGLIAEEVAKVYPEMVAYDKDGQVLTVRYQLLAPMLLNEVQKQSAQLQKQAAENRKLEDRLAALEALLSSKTATAAQPASSQ